MKMVSKSQFVMTIECKDRTGLVAEIAKIVLGLGGNIIESGNWTDIDSPTPLFFMRVAWTHSKPITREKVEKHIDVLRKSISGKVELHSSLDIPKVAILVTREFHCLDEVLLGVRRGNLPMEIAFIASNRDDLKNEVTKFYQLPFFHLPVDSQNKKDQEKQLLALLHKHNVSMLILAKYMQILSGDFLKAFPNVINIHHSFLPAFKGADPYRQAHERGVKIIGATTHFATEHLDEGPIIEQATREVGEGSISQFREKGSELEERTLRSTIKKILEHRVVRYGKKTVVFE